MDTLIGQKNEDGYVSEYTDQNGMHYHKCPRCGSVWQHPEGGGSFECNETRHGRSSAHRCPKPKCKGIETWKYELSSVVRIDYPWEKSNDRQVLPGVGQREEASG